MAGRQKVTEWDSVIFEMKQEHPEWGPGRILSNLLQAAKTAGQTVHISERTVARRLNWFMGQPGNVQSSFGFFRWPESMVRDLPPESSVCGFELWREVGRRPSVRLVRAFWTVCLALPGEPFELRHRIALLLLDARDDEESLRFAEARVLTKELPATAIRKAKFPPGTDGRTVLDWFSEANGRFEEQERIAAALDELLTPEEEE